MSLTFNFGSASSARSNVRDAIESYRRAQYLVAGSTVASGADVSALDEDEDDEESQTIRALQFEDDLEDADENATTSERDQEDSFVGQMQWDEDYDTGPQPQSILRRDEVTQSFSPKLRGAEAEALIPGAPASFQSPSSEQTPLLNKVSFPVLPTRRLSEVSLPDRGPMAGGTQYQTTTGPPLRRRSSSGSVVASTPSSRRGHSTFGQTLFNSIAILLGIGMLSEPLAFSYAGWGVGTFLIVSYGFVSCYTAKILGRIILSDPRIRSYSDIGRKAFGPRITPLISLMFCLELFTVCVILVTLYGDSLHSLFPQYSSNFFKAWGMILLIPTVFLPLSLLSYTSILGILSTILIVIVVFVDGFTKPETPGSLWKPAHTNFGVKSYRELGIAFGLFMAGFSGHAVIPSLARDMDDPTRFDTMINWAFTVATLLYMMIGYAGYLMFGNSVSDEISIDLLRTPGYNSLLNQICLWMLVLSPLSKFALNTQPLHATIEILLRIDAPFSSPEDLVDKPDGLSILSTGTSYSWRRTLSIVQRILLTGAIVFVSIAIPEFSSMMAILGSFSAFMLSIVGPVIAKIMIGRSCTIFDGVVISVGIVMAVWGTLATFA